MSRTRDRRERSRPAWRAVRVVSGRAAGRSRMRAWERGAAVRRGRAWRGRAMIGRRAWRELGGLVMAMAGCVRRLRRRRRRAARGGRGAGPGTAGAAGASSTAGAPGAASGVKADEAAKSAPPKSAFAPVAQIQRRSRAAAAPGGGGAARVDLNLTMLRSRRPWLTVGVLQKGRSSSRSGCALPGWWVSVDRRPRALSRPARPDRDGHDGPHRGRPGAARLGAKGWVQRVSDAEQWFTGVASMGIARGAGGADDDRALERFVHAARAGVGPAMQTAGAQEGGSAAGSTSRGIRVTSEDRGPPGGIRGDARWDRAELRARHQGERPGGLEAGRETLDHPAPTRRPPTNRAPTRCAR